jgi:hypothetical protein
VAQNAIVAGMINARLVDPHQMRDWLQSLIDALKASGPLKSLQAPFSPVDLDSVAFEAVHGTRW